MPRKSPGGPRDAVLSVRVPARLKFGLDLIARMHRESVPDVIIRALNDALTSENGGLLVDLPGEDQATYLLPRVWDERDCVRVVKLALLQPSLLTRTEQLVWEFVRADDKYWATPKGKTSKKGASVHALRHLEEVQVPVLEADWDELVRRAGVA